MKEIIKVTRRQFVKIAGYTVGAALYSWNFAKFTYAAVKDNIATRQESVYVQDTKMKVRKSQDSPAVKKIYKDFLHEPCGHMSHHLLHTHYVDRSARVKQLKAKGLKLKV
ncbi:MAG TPA: iron hydrogenase small subunit [Desulfobacterales bacterium]|nr:iron hydrogenase small subunit [Desulfobacterales bacterium]